jgi:hypothetical protein
VRFCVIKGCWSFIPVLPAYARLLFFHFFEELQRCTWPIVGLHMCIHTLPLDNPPTCTGYLSDSSVPVLRRYFAKKRRSSPSLSEVILLRGLLDLALVSVLVVYSQGMTLAWLAFHQNISCVFFNSVLRQVGESSWIFLFDIVSDSVRYAFGPKVISWSCLVSIFPLFALEENKFIFKFLILKQVTIKNILSLLYLVK